MKLFSRRYDELNNKICDLKREILEMRQLTLQRQDAQLNILRIEINEIKKQLEPKKKSPYKNHFSKARKREIKINPKKTYTVDWAAKNFGVTGQAICVRIRAILKDYIEPEKKREFFYKAPNGFKEKGKTGTMWLITPKGLRLLARSYEVEVIE